jgi:hypothetical protein
VKDAIDEALGHGARARLQALFDTLIPADETPGAWEGGARFYLERELNRDLAWAREPLRALVAALDEIAVERYGSAFAHLTLRRRGPQPRRILGGESPVSQMWTEPGSTDGPGW